MLCDQIIEYGEKVKFKLPGVMNAYHEMGKKIKNAQRFVLNRNAVMTTHSVSECTPKRFLSALNICRMPYSSMWVEFAFQDRTDWMDEAQKRGLEIAVHKDASQPSRLGFYMEKQNKDGKAILVILCWSHPINNLPKEMQDLTNKFNVFHDDYSLSICHMAMAIHMDDHPYTLTLEHRNVVNDYIANVPKERKKVYSRWMNNPEDIEASYELEARIHYVLPEILHMFWLPLFQEGEPTKDNLDYYVELAQYDLKCEWRFILSLLILLNSRNVIEIGVESDMSKVNKARLKRGVQPLMSYREINLNMSRVQKRRLGVGVNLKDLQKHIVSGHWKVRKHGVYWWNDFVRGNIGTAPPTTTIVKG